MILFKEEINGILQGETLSSKETKRPNSIFSEIRKVKPFSLFKGSLVFIVLTLIGLSIGTVISTYVFFGILTLTGLIAISESNSYVRHLVTKSNRFIDITLFVLTVYATISLGVTITASLTFAGLGYSLVYGPWLRSQNK